MKNYEYEYKGYKCKTNFQMDLDSQEKFKKWVDRKLEEQEFYGVTK